VSVWHWAVQSSRKNAPPDVGAEGEGVGEGAPRHADKRMVACLLASKDTLQDSPGRPNMEIRSLLAKLKGFRSRMRMAANISRYLIDLQKTLGVEKARYPRIEADKLFDPTYRHKHHDSPSCAICAKCEKKRGRGSPGCS
jgi:hypothetical protein